MRTSFEVIGCSSGVRSTTGSGGLKTGHDGGAESGRGAAAGALDDLLGLVGLVDLGLGIALAL